MSESGSDDRSHHRHRRRRTPFVAFYGPFGEVGGGGNVYQDYNDPQFDFLRNHPRMQFHGGERTPSPPYHPSSPPPRRHSWLAEVIERLSADINNCGFEPSRKPASKPEAKPKLAEEQQQQQQSSEQEKVAMETMNAKLTKLEEALKSVQNTLQSCLERLGRGGGEGQDREAAGEWRDARYLPPVWRQKRYRTPDRYLYEY